jgi:hypothetical protein
VSTPPEELHRIAVAIERLDAKVEVGFATMRGDMRLVGHGLETTVKRVDDVEDDVEQLKSRRFPLPVIGGLCGVAAVVLTGFQMTGKA